MQDSNEFVDVKRFVPVIGQRLVLIHEDEPFRDNEYFTVVSIAGEAIKLQEARLGHVVILTLANVESHGAVLRPLQAGEKMPRAKQMSRKEIEKKIKKQMKGK